MSAFYLLESLSVYPHYAAYRDEGIGVDLFYGLENYACFVFPAEYQYDLRRLLGEPTRSVDYRTAAVEIGDNSVGDGFMML